MASKRIETQLTIKAVDRYSSKLKAMGKVTGRFSDKVRSDMKGMQNLRGPLKMIDDFNKQKRVVKDSSEALAQANKKVGQLLRTIKATKNPTAKMRREFDKARSSAARLEDRHRGNRRALHALQVKLRSAGVNTADLAGEQRRLAEALNKSTGAFDRQMDKMRRLETMQNRIATARERMDKALARSASLSLVGGAAMQTGRRILENVSGVANRAGDRQSGFTEFQNLTGASDERIVALRGELSELRDVTKLSVQDMLDGLSVLVGKGMELEDALAVLPATGRSAKATKTELDQMANSGFALFDNLKVAPEEMRQAFDIMAMAGKAGGFELTAMSRKFPEVTAGARALKMEGLDATAALAAALQVAMKSAGSEDQAATNMANFFGKITAPDTVKKFKKFGVDVEHEMRTALERGVDPMEHMLVKIKEMTGGDAFKMGELFADKQVLDFLRAMVPNLEEYRRIKREALGADGVIDADLARLMEDFKEQKGQLGESIGELFTLPPEVLESFTKLLKKADALVERMILWKKEHPKLTKILFIGAGAVGAMAVAGGALLTAAAGLIGTLAVLRFGMVGFGARALFAGGSLAGLATKFAGLSKLPVFALASLIKPLKWVAGLLPDFAPALARFTAFRIAASLEMVKLARNVAASTAAMSKSLMFGTLGRYLLRVAPVVTGLYYGLGIKPTANGELTPQADESLKSQDQGDLDNMHERDTKFRKALDVVQAFEGESALPTPERIAELREEMAAYREEVEAAQEALKGAPEFASGITNPLRVQAQTDLDAAKAGLRDAQDELAKTETASGELSSALQVLDGTQVTVTINAEAIDRALDKVRQLSSGLQSLPGGAPQAASPKPPALAGKRAFGGPVIAGLPYLVNENTPRSEIFVPSMSGGILNVAQAGAALASRYGGMAHGFQNGLAALAVSSAVLPAAMQAGAAPMAHPGAAGGQARVEIGSIHIVAPSGVSDPEALADLLERRLGERLQATISASFSD